MADITGFSPDVAKQQLDDFLKYGKVVRGKAADTYHDFLRSLYENWCSPKASDFTRQHLHKLCAFHGDIDTLYTQIYRSAVDAYNIIARANGWSSMAQDDQKKDDASFNETMGTLLLREANENGVVGMNVANVKLARDLYLTQMNDVINLMNETPMNIAFFDPGDEQKTAFRSIIKTRVDLMQERINEAMATLNEAMETEENTILIAKESAAQTLSA